MASTLSQNVCIIPVYMYFCVLNEPNDFGFSMKETRRRDALESRGHTDTLRVPTENS